MASLPALRLALASALEAYCTERGRTLAEVVAAMDWRSRGKLGKQEVMALVRTLMQGAAAPSDEDTHALAMDAVGAGADGEVGVEQLRDYLDSARRPPPPDDGGDDDAPAGPAADPFPVVPPVEPPWVANLAALPADAAPHARMHGHFLANERRAHLVRTSVAQRTARAARRIAAVELAHTEVLTDAPLINASYEITIPPDNSDADPDVHYAVARNERAAWRATSRHAPPPNPPSLPHDEAELADDLLLARGERADASAADRRAMRDFWARRRRAARLLSAAAPPRLNDARARAQAIADAGATPTSYLDVGRPAALPAWRRTDLARQRVLDRAARRGLPHAARPRKAWCDAWQPKPAEESARRGLPFADEPHAAHPADTVPQWGGAGARGRSRIHECARVGDAATLARLLRFAPHKFASDAAQPDARLVTPLHLACRCAPDAENRDDAGALACAHLLLAAGASPGAATSEKAGKETPLHLACARGHAALVATLLDCAPPHPRPDGWVKADVGARDANEQTPLHRAVNFGGTGGRACADLLIEHGADIRVKDVDGSTPVHIMCSRGDSTLLKRVLRKVGRPGAAEAALSTDLRLRTPMHHAVAHASGTVPDGRRAASDSPKPSAFARCGAVPAPKRGAPGARAWRDVDAICSVLHGHGADPGAVAEDGLTPAAAAATAARGVHAPPASRALADKLASWASSFRRAPSSVSSAGGQQPSLR